MVALARFFNRPTLTWGGLAILLLILSALAKPNYALAVVSSLPLLVAISNLRGRRHLILWTSIFCALVVVFLFQWCIFCDSWPNRSVGFSPFFVIGYRSACPPLSILTSISFPACVFLLMPEAREDRVTQVAWVVFAVAALQALTLVEGGDARQFLHGNWFWGAHQALTVLFVVSGACVLRLWDTCSTNVRYLLVLMLLMHFLSGLCYVAKQYMGLGFG